MKNEINNCGLVALRNISSLRDISVRTLICIAEDNGITLYPYKVPLNKIEKVKLPAIFHADNHFVFATNHSELKKYNLTGNVLLTEKSDYELIPTQHQRSVVGATGAIVGVGLAAVSIGLGVAKDVKANKANKAAQAQIKPYKIPQAVLDVLQATEANAGSGFDKTTLNYLTSQTDNAFGGSLATAERLGADPNILSSIFAQKVDAISGIAAQDHQLQMANFSAYINALNATGANDAVEQKSQQDLLKDQLQKIAQDKAVASQQISQGINAGISGLSTAAMMKLYGQPKVPDVYSPRTSNTTGYLPPPVTPNSQNLRQTGLQIPQ